MKSTDPFPKKDQVIAEQAEQLAEAYEKLHRLEEDIRVRTDKLTIQQAKMFEYIRFYTHKLRGTLASIVGLLQLAQTEGMSPNLKELFEMMNTCTRQLDEVLRDFTQRLQNDL